MNTLLIIFKVKIHLFQGKTKVCVHVPFCCAGFEFAFCMTLHALRGNSLYYNFTFVSPVT